MGSVRARLTAEKERLFPVFLKLGKQRCLVVGAGKTAAEKIPRLLGCGAVVSVVAPAAMPKIQAWARAGKLFWIPRRFEPEDLNDTFLCVVAASSKAVNQVVYEEARQRGILCNAVHDGAHCNFYYPAVVERGPLQIAISTAGHSGALARRLRQELEGEFGPEWESWLGWLREARCSLYDDAVSPKKRRTLLRKLADRKTQEEFFQRWGVTGQGKPRAK